MAPDSRRRAHTRERLIEAAVAVFADQGVAGATVEEICDRAGFTRGAFYSNFGSKDELCVAVVERKGRDMIEAARRSADQIPAEPVQPQSAEAIIRAAVEVYCAGQPVDAEWAIARSELQLYSLRNPSIRLPLARVEHELAQVFADVVAGAIARQPEARFIVPVDQLLDLLEAYWDRLTNQALLEGTDSTLPDRADQLTTLVQALVRLPAGTPAV